MKKFIKDNIWIIITCLLVIIICYLFPYSQDDWYWGSSYGINKLNELFKNYNGRYAGNLLILLISRYRILRMLIESLTLILTVFFINKIIGSKQKYMLPLSIILILCIPANVLSQSIAWASGFANYVIPVLIALIYIYINKDLFKLEVKKKNKLLIIPCLLLAFIGCLFIEHLTLYLVLLSLAVNIPIYIKTKKVDIINLAFLLGSIIGAIVMFSNGGYTNVVNGTDGYRSVVESNLISSIIKTYFSEISSYMITANTVLNIALSGSFLYLIYKEIKSKSKYNKILKAEFIFLLVFLLYTIFKCFVGNSSKIYLCIDGVLNALYMLCIIYNSFLLVKDKETRYKILFFALSIIVVCTPLFVVNPIGPRCFYVTYIFFSIITCLYINTLLKETKVLVNGLKTLSLVLLIVLGAIYFTAFKVEMERKDYIEENRDKETLVLPNVPFDDYVWRGNPYNESFVNKFKDFYDIDDDTKVEFVDYKEWKETK